MLKRSRTQFAACGAYLKQAHKEKDTSYIFYSYLNTIHVSGSAERKHFKVPQQEPKKCVGGKLVSQEFNYVTPVFCQMSFVTNKSWAEWETSPKQEERDLQIPDESCAVRIQRRQLSQASQIINTTPAAIHNSSHLSIKTTSCTLSQYLHFHKCTRLVLVPLLRVPSLHFLPITPSLILLYYFGSPPLAFTFISTT